jgi:DNA repair exonuclease SbcCD ATPase subunit
LACQIGKLRFDVERENKSGGVTKGFVVFVKSPSNTEPVRWENWSGGETQRLQLAGDLGLANLIMLQAGLSNTVEFFDEPSTHLSPEGMMDLADILHDRAITDGKRIWIVDHASITNFGDFEGIITARKDSDGSTIEYNPS